MFNYNPVNLYEQCASVALDNQMKHFFVYEIEAFKARGVLTLY